MNALVVATLVAELWRSDCESKVGERLTRRVAE